MPTATGSAAAEPKPAFSTTTATAIEGSSPGREAKQTNHAWSSPPGFCAVPVLPRTSRPGRSAFRAVPVFTTPRIAAATRSAARAEKTRPSASGSESSARRGAIITPWFAMAETSSARCSGVARRRPWPIEHCASSRFSARPRRGRLPRWEETRCAPLV